MVSSSGFFQVRQTCPVCSGSGRMITKPCRECRGTGRQKGRKRITLRIPPGVETGARLRLAGRGEGGMRGGPAGDLYVILHVRPHALFRREEGNDVLCDVPVPAHIAALGGDVEVPTLDGFARLKIDPGIETGKMFRLRGKGAPSVDGYGRGDLHVRVIVEVPTHLSSRQKKALKDFGDSCTDDNHPLGRKIHESAEAFYKAREALGKTHTDT